VQRQEIGITGEQVIGSSGKGQFEKLVVARIATQLDTLDDRDKLDHTRELDQEHRGSDGAIQAANLGRRSTDASSWSVPWEARMTPVPRA
jgi:hypothetical protein